MRLRVLESLVTDVLLSPASRCHCFARCLHARRIHWCRWPEITINGFRFVAPKKCTRCKVTTINPDNPSEGDPAADPLKVGCPCTQCGTVLASSCQWSDRACGCCCCCVVCACVGVPRPSRRTASRMTGTACALARCVWKPPTSAWHARASHRWHLTSLRTCGPAVVWTTGAGVCVALRHVQNLIPRWSSKVARARPTLSVGAEVVVESFGYIPYK